MEIIENLMSQPSQPIVQTIFILGLYVLVSMMYNIGSIIYNTIHAFVSALSVAHCAISSAKQKAIATQTVYGSTWTSVGKFIWQNFILHLTASGDVVYDSPDFRWNGIFDFDTYTTHIRKIQ